MRVHKLWENFHFLVNHPFTSQLSKTNHLPKIYYKKKKKLILIPPLLDTHSYRLHQVVYLHFSRQVAHTKCVCVFANCSRLSRSSNQCAFMWTFEETQSTDEQTAVDMWLNPCLSLASSTGSELALCWLDVGRAPGTIAGPRKMRQSCCGTLKFEEEKSLELRIDYPTFIWIYQQLLGSLWAPHIPPSLAALKKTLAEANTGNPMGREWRIFMEHDLRGRIAFKGSIFIYRLTLFNKPSFYHCWLAIKIMIKIWI